MRHILFIFLLILCYRGLHGDNQPTVAPANNTASVMVIRKTVVKTATSGDLLNDATALYEQVKDEPGSAVYECGEFLLVKVCISNPNDRQPAFLEGSAMLETNNLLRRFYSLPEKFRFDSISILNTYDETTKVYHYVTALKKAELTQTPNKENK